MGEALDGRYWCHICSQIVDPIMEIDVKCPICESGFVEEITSSREDNLDPGSERVFSLFAPILLGLVGGSRPRRRFPREEEEEDNRGESEQDREWLNQRRRRRGSAVILRLLQDLNSDDERGDGDSVILINSLNQARLFRADVFDSDEENEIRSAPGSLGDYLTGAGLDMLLQHLAENDPSRYGTPPAKEEAIEAMPTVKISEKNLQCAVCLDEFALGSQAREMPCRHKFHGECIVPWLELHSSCPICRFQIPAENGLKMEGNGSVNANLEEDNDEDEGAGSSDERGTAGESGGRRRFRIQLPWLFNGLLSPESQGGGNPSSSASGRDYPGGGRNI